MEISNPVYCDVVPGELIFFFHDQNRVSIELIDIIRRNELEHVGIIESMNEKLQYLGLDQADYFTYQLFLLRVPEGSEIMKINWIFEKYRSLLLNFIDKAFKNNNQADIEQANSYIRGDETSKFIVIPNGYHSLNAGVGISNVDSFIFTDTHNEYKSTIHTERMSRINNYQKVLLIDSGIEKEHSLNIVNQVNFLAAYELEDGKRRESIQLKNLPSLAIDENGHGTALANIINDICPGIPIVIYKIVDKSGCSTEWNLLAALIAKNDAKVINISLSYGLPKINCRQCGRLSTSTRSYVMEYALANTQGNGNKIIVVSGGNEKQGQLSFPARFDYALGVISLNRSNDLSSFSNFGNTNFWGDKHPNIVCAPGGEIDTEPIFYSPYGINGWGTSFAACYVTALIAYVWSRCPEIARNDYEFILFCIKEFYVDQELPGYSRDIFGNGRIVIHGNADKEFDDVIEEWKKYSRGDQSIFSMQPKNVLEEIQKV